MVLVMYSSSSCYYWCYYCYCVPVVAPVVHGSVLVLVLVPAPSIPCITSTGVPVISSIVSVELTPRESLNASGFSEGKPSGFALGFAFGKSLGFILSLGRSFSRQPLRLFNSLSHIVANSAVPVYTTKRPHNMSLAVANNMPAPRH